MKKNDNVEKVRKPSFFWYGIGARIMRLFSYFYWHLRVDNKEIRKLKSPILAIAPHSSTLDIVPTAATLLPKRYNVVMGKDLFTWKQLRPFIKSFGAIPKDQGAIDIACMRTLKAAAEQGRNILLYPEGKTSLDGKQFFYLGPSIGKFIKFLDCNVVAVQTNGAYLTKPRFIKGFRRGKIETKARLLFTQEEVRTLPVKEIVEKVRKALEFNDNVWQQENHVRFKSKDTANNLNYILYKCPKCGAEYEMTAENGLLSCKECGNTVRYTEYGELIPQGDSKTFERIDLWVDYERESVTEEISKDDFFVTKAVTAYLRNDEKNIYEEKGKGSLTIDKEKIVYTGTEKDEQVELTYSLTEVPTVVTKNSEGIDLIINNKPYRFLFDEHKWSYKYELIVERLFAVKHKLP